MRSKIAITLCFLAGVGFEFAYYRGTLSVDQALTFTAGVWMFTGLWLGQALGRLTEKDRYRNAQRRAPLAPVPQVMVAGGIVLSIVALVSHAL